jgi:hydroxypyruvate reductase
MHYRNHAKEIYAAAVAAVQPATLLPQYLQLKGNLLHTGSQRISLAGSHLYVIGAGKAAAAMAQTTEQLLGHFIQSGFISTKYKHALPLQIIKCMEAAHPVPDENSIKAMQQTIALLQQTKPGDHILCLLSGGASALWADVPDGIRLEELQQTFQLLLNSGADIAEMNCVRKHVSNSKGGQLLRYAPHTHWHTFIISDVPGNNLETIASGPTSADPTSFTDAWKIIQHYQLEKIIPASVAQHLQKGIDGSIAETIKPGDALLQQVTHTIIGSNETALQAAAHKATALGYTVFTFPASLQSEATEHAAAIMHQAGAYEGAQPACFIYGGETTVTVTGNGMGGRNQQLALCTLQHYPANKHITLLAAGTDGTDGPTDAAGAFADAAVVQAAAQQQLQLNHAITQNDAYPFFKQCDGLFITGATQTNVMDLVIVLIH